MIVLASLPTVQIRDIMPDVSVEYAGQCLEWTRGDVEAAVRGLVEGNMPSEKDIAQRLKDRETAAEEAAKGAQEVEPGEKKEEAFSLFSLKSDPQMLELQTALVRMRRCV